MDRKQQQALRELVEVTNDNGRAVSALEHLATRFETNQVNMEALLAVMAGAKIKPDFLTRKEAVNDDADGGDDE